MTEQQSPRVLLIGYGNPGRLDDGLGPALAEAFEALELPGLTVDADYQLTVEDAGAVAKHDAVIFADASVNGKEPFFFQAIRPEGDFSFTSHSVEPKAVLALARNLFQAETRGFILGIRGYEFNEFGEKISPKARENLDKAIQFLQKLLAEGGLEDWTESVN